MFTCSNYSIPSYITLTYKQCTIQEKTAHNTNRLSAQTYFQHYQHVIVTLHLHTQVSTLQCWKWKLVGIIYCPYLLKAGSVLQLTDIPPAPINHCTRYSPTAHHVGKLLLISYPRISRKLSWGRHTVVWQLTQGCLEWSGWTHWTCKLLVTSPIHYYH